MIDNNQISQLKSDSWSWTKLEIRYAVVLPLLNGNLVWFSESYHMHTLHSHTIFIKINLIIKFFCGLKSNNRNILCKTYVYSIYCTNNFTLKIKKSGRGGLPSPKFKNVFDILTCFKGWNQKLKGREITTKFQVWPNGNFSIRQHYLANMGTHCSPMKLDCHANLHPRLLNICPHISVFFF